MSASVFALPCTAMAQDAAGEWHGKLTIPSGDLRIDVTIEAKRGGYEGSLVSLDQGPNVIALADVKLEGDALSFSVPSIGATYAAHWDGAHKSWAGDWRQGAALLPLALTAGKSEPLPVVAGLDGDWAAAVPLAGGAKLRLVLHVRTGDGGTAVTLDSPDQLAYGIRLSTLTRKGQTVAFSINGSRFEGTLAADGHAMDGSWTGASYKGPLTFVSRAVAASGPKRPQTPQPPFPYRTEEVVVDSVPGVKLAGTLTLPQGKGPFPAVVMITGSGAQDRDETIFGHKPFAVIADRLTRDGIAVLRVDDRGYARSTGDFASASDDDFAADTTANVSFLRRRPDIDPTRIGLIGHSEGGLIAPKVAAKDPELAFIVLMAGPGAPSSEVVRAQSAALAPAMGATPDQIQKANKLRADVVEAMRGARDEADAKARALKVINAEGGALAATPAAAEALATQMSSPGVRGLMDYDPRPTLAKVKCPILALNGSKDRQVPADQNLPAIRAATSGNPDVTVVQLPGLNHMFQTANTGAAGEYADIEETVAPIALDTMSLWIRKHVAR